MKIEKCYFCRDEKQTKDLLTFKVDPKRHILFDHYTFEKNGNFSDKDYLACKNCYSQFVPAHFKKDYEIQYFNKQKQLWNSYKNNL